MTTKMLINATRSQMLRVAIVEGTILQEYQVEIAEGGLTRGNIYRGVVANIQPSLNAAFIDIGEERHAFLPVADVLPSAYHRNPPSADAKRPRIDQVLEKGKPILVQVTKDGVGQKGAALTTNIALAGRYLVLTPFDEVRGISRKAEDDDERKTVRERLKRLVLPDGCGVIVRTNGLEQNQTTLTKDLNALLRLWRSVQAEGQNGHGPRLVYSDQDLVVQMLRDYLDVDIAQVVVDSDEVFAKVDEYMKAFMPRSKTKLIRYAERLPLFSRYRIETQIDRIYERTAPLPGGGSIVIDSTEALTAIDVNSGRATRTTDHDESIFNINVEAALEVARQLRLRDIGGLVVVDFIDMRFRKHQNKLEKVMRDAMTSDKARYSVGRISPNGLLEINRQRIKQALRLRTHRPCPTCQGAASTPTPDFAALRILTRIEARASTGLMKSVTFALHPEIADALQNGHRKELAAIENDYAVELVVISAPGLAHTEERVEWVEREAGSEPVIPRHDAVVRAADLTRAEHEEAAEAKVKAQAKALPVKQGKRKASEAVPIEKTANGDEEGEKRRRRRRRRRRRTTEEGALNAEGQLLHPNGDPGDPEGDFEDDGEGEGDYEYSTGVESQAPQQVNVAPAPIPVRERPRRGRGERNKRLKRGPEAEGATPATPATAQATAEAPAALTRSKPARPARPPRPEPVRPPVEIESDEDLDLNEDGDFLSDADDYYEGEGEGGEAGENGEAGEGADGDRPGRRRRRRRRGGRGRRKKGAAGTPEGQAEATEALEAQEAREALDEAPLAEAAEETEAILVEPADVEIAAAADDEVVDAAEVAVEVAVEEAPVPAPRVRSRPSSRRKAAPKAAPAEEPIAPEPAEEPVAEAPPEPEPEPEAPAAVPVDDEPATPGRRKKRTSTRSRKPAAEAPVAEAPAEAPDTEEPQPVSNESALHQAAGYNTAPAAPIGVITGQGVDRTGSNRLRWQWWGGLKGEGGPPPEDDGSPGSAEE